MSKKTLRHFDEVENTSKSIKYMLMAGGICIIIGLALFIGIKMKNSIKPDDDTAVLQNIVKLDDGSYYVSKKILDNDGNEVTQFGELREYTDAQGYKTIKQAEEVNVDYVAGSNIDYLITEPNGSIVVTSAGDIASNSDAKSASGLDSGAYFICKYTNTTDSDWLVNGTGMFLADVDDVYYYAKDGDTWYIREYSNTDKFVVKPGETKLFMACAKHDGAADFCISNSMNLAISFRHK